MEQKKLSWWLKGIVIGIGLCGGVVYGYVLPVMGQGLVQDYPEFSGWFWPWLLFLWLTAVPCYMVLLDGWKIASEIGADRSFSTKNARLLKRISILAAGDCAFFFAGNLVFFILNMNHPSVFLASIFVILGGVAVSVAAAVLSHLVYKAAGLQEENELTI